MSALLWLALWAAFSVVTCAACSVLETVLFSARPENLLSDRGRPGVSIFLDLKEKRIGDAISAILIINTVAGTIGPGFVGAQAARIWGDASVAIASAVLTFLIVILSEIAPKTYAATHADSLASMTGRVLKMSIWVLSPALVVTRRITDWLSGDGQDVMTRTRLARIIASGPSQGALSGVESEVLSHILYAHEVRLSDIVTPLDLVVAASEVGTVDLLLSKETFGTFARIPLHRGDERHLVGYVNQREVLREALRDSVNQALPLSTFSHALPELDENLSVGRGIAALLDAREPIGAVVHRGEAIGIVTLEDLFEALLGVDITDEEEEETRSAADARRRERVERLRQKRREWSGIDQPSA